MEVFESTARLRRLRHLQRLIILLSIILSSITSIQPTLYHLCREGFNSSCDVSNSSTICLCGESGRPRFIVGEKRQGFFKLRETTRCRENPRLNPGIKLSYNISRASYGLRVQKLPPFTEPPRLGRRDEKSEFPQGDHTMLERREIGEIRRNGQII